ncbi:hypothetical protein M231_06092 [Tremella mesenterica]|uniref:Uncharacterized protein n=1 Tax=Tremella mesenterica TaxID=5217 RepID=A0A4Q1BCR3_TREME|nr:hypothetical protein M231_06092 [Tremella mesenterica]
MATNQEDQTTNPEHSQVYTHPKVHPHLLPMTISPRPGDKYDPTLMEEVKEDMTRSMINHPDRWAAFQRAAINNRHLVYRPLPDNNDNAGTSTMFVYQPPQPPRQIELSPYSPVESSIAPTPQNVLTDNQLYDQYTSPNSNPSELLPDSYSVPDAYVGMVEPSDTLAQESQMTVNRLQDQDPITGYLVEGSDENSGFFLLGLGESDLREGGHGQ